jgi:glycosyltransferase involved in cell wall biosynthesis
MPEPASVPAPFLSVVVPFYNEADNAESMVGEVVAALRRYRGDWELLCVDDGSEDGTAQRLERAAGPWGDQVRVLRLRRNFGQTAALQAGIDASRGELIATLDGDRQNDPADLPRMVEELLERDLDLLAGWRRNRQDGYFLRLLPSKIANLLIRRVTGVRIRDYGCGTRVFRGDVLRRIRLFGEMHRFIPVWIAGVTSPSRIGETPVNHRPRTRGRSKYGLSRAFRVVPDLLAVFFFLRYRARPGHFFGLIGIAFGLVGSAIMAWLLITKFGFGQDIGDRPLLLLGVLALVFSIQFLTTGVLAELLARTYFESPRAPSYVLVPGDDRPEGPERQAPTGAGLEPATKRSWVPRTPHSATSSNTKQQ